MADPSEQTPGQGRAATPSRTGGRGQGKGNFRDIYQRPTGFRSRPFVIALVALLLILLLAADGLYVVVRMGDELRGAGQHLERGQEGLTDGDLLLSEKEFTLARRAARSARGLTGHPALVLATLFPYVQEDARTLRALPEVVELTSEAGLTTVRAGKRLGGTTGKELARAFYQNGRVRLETIEAAEPFVTEANRLLERALKLLSPLDPRLDALAAGVDDSRNRLSAAADLTETGSALLQTLPPLLGSERPARYLLVFQSNSEARGTGGLIALYGILEAINGRVNLTHVGPFEELTDALSPAEIQELRASPALERFDATLNNRLEANLSAEFPLVAPALLDIYEGATGRRLDGVLATDPPALQDLTNATGRLNAPGIPRGLGPDNTSSELLHDSYLRYARDPTGQNALLIGVIRDLYEALGSDLDGPTLVKSFTKAVASQHLKLYSVSHRLQGGLKELGAAGSAGRLGENVQLVYHNNLATNKVDYFLRRTLTTKLTLDEDGNVFVRTSVSLHNDAPSVRNAMTLSYAQNAAPGLNRMQLNMVMPQNADPGRWSINGEGISPELAREGGFPVAFTELEIAAGDTARVTMNYELPAATDLFTGGDFTFVLLPQATATPDRFELIFRPPPGFAVTSTGGGKRVGSGSLSDSGMLDRPVVHEVQITPL